MITYKEKEVLNKTADVWNDFLALPQLHPSDNDEFKFHIHALQNIILSRTAYRILNNIDEKGHKHYGQDQNTD